MVTTTALSQHGMRESSRAYGALMGTLPRSKLSHLGVTVGGTATSTLENMGMFLAAVAEVTS